MLDGHWTGVRQHSGVVRQASDGCRTGVEQSLVGHQMGAGLASDGPRTCVRQASDGRWTGVRCKLNGHQTDIGRAFAVNVQIYLLQNLW